MKIFYPYNEILPKHKAHDVFIFNECVALAKSGCDVSLLCGKGSFSDNELYNHYDVPPNPNFRICPMPIIRKNNPFNFSWGRYFNAHVQREIERFKPDAVLLSIFKPACYHLAHKVSGVRYIYEVHQLHHYPNHLAECAKECAMLARADLITVTTNALKDILQSPPYSITIPIEVVPLAVNAEPLPPPPPLRCPLHLFYVGQLYEGQGIDRLLYALCQVRGVHLTVIGGKPEEVEHYKKMAQKLVLGGQTSFLGFRKPSELPELVSEAHAFVAPFSNCERMPYVAHTKLYEYARWGRPLIAPALPSVEEHFKDALLYEPDSITSLAAAIERAKSEASILPSDAFTWPSRASHYRKLLTS